MSALTGVVNNTLEDTLSILKQARDPEICYRHYVVHTASKIDPSRYSRLQSSDGHSVL